MQEYASQDVLYLPKVYEAMKKMIIKENKNHSIIIRNNQSSYSNSKFDVTSAPTSDSASLYESSSSDQDDISVSTHYSSSVSNNDKYGGEGTKWDTFSGEIFEKT